MTNNKPKVVAYARTGALGRILPHPWRLPVVSDWSPMYSDALIRLSDYEALKAERDGLLAQHHRDSAELRRICDERDQSRRTAEYWKAEHLAGNAKIERLRGERDAAFALLRECQLILREECGARIDYVELNAFLKGEASAKGILAALDNAAGDSQ